MSDLSADELLESYKAAFTKTKVDDAKDLLTDLLSSGTAVPAEDVYQSIAANGMSKRTVDNAKKALGIRSVKIKDRWFWSMPRRDE